MSIGSNLAPTTTLTLGSTGTITTNNGTLQSQSLSAVNNATNMSIGGSHASSISIGQAGVSTTNLYGTNQAGTIDAFTTTGTLKIKGHVIVEQDLTVEGKMNAVSETYFGNNITVSGEADFQGDIKSKGSLVGTE